MNSKVQLISAQRCGSTIVQYIAGYIIHGKAKFIEKSHNLYRGKTYEDSSLIITVRNPIHQWISLYRFFYLNKNCISNKITKEEILNFHNEKPEELGNLEMNISCIHYFKKLSQKVKSLKVLFIEYEKYHNSSNYDLLISDLCKFLNKDCSQELINEINFNYNKKIIKKSTDEVGTYHSVVSDPNMRIFHGNHIGSDILDYSSIFTKDGLLYFEYFINPFVRIYKKLLSV